jgi:hypothetical protein
MKKIIFTGSGITLLMLAITLISYGQPTTTGLRFSNGVAAENSSSKTATTLSRADVKSRAAKNFSTSYKGVSNEKWYEVPDGLIAKFTYNGIDCRVDYDKKGNWLHTIRTYDENELPGDLRHVVKTSYYDYNIIVVHEIEQPRNNFTYIVHLEGKTQLINLRIHDGEMEEWQKFDKSK